MKIQHLLLFVLATLVFASDDAEESPSGLLRGSTIRNWGEQIVDSYFDEPNVHADQKHRKTQQFWRPPITDNLYWKPILRTWPPTGLPTPVPAPTLPPPTQPPTPVPAPTLRPTEAPTPVPAPTNPPTLPPTEPPTPVPPPTSPPTQVPTNPPTQSPTDPPTPIPAPTSPPTRVPTVSPTHPPTQYPSPKPPPTIPPTLPPTRLPTPSEAPTISILKETFDSGGNRCGMTTPGTVILHGGIFNYSDPMSDSLGQAIVREMRTNGDNRILDPLVFVPGTRRDVSLEDEITFENQWRDVMAPGVPFSVLHPNGTEPDSTNIADAAEADTEEFVRPLTTAMGVFLPGGRQWRFIDAYKYTQTEEELWGVLNRGGVIAGTSAGAAVMADVMPRGDPSGSGTLLSPREWYQHGLGFVSNIAIDNHVDRRGRQLAMYDVLNDKPENRNILGIGLNENSLIVVKGKYFQVLGDRGANSVVRVYDCSQISLFQTCTFANAPYLELTVGDWYDLCDRRQLPGPPQLEEDVGLESTLGAYKRPWSFGNDFKAGNPSKFICSGRTCTFKANPIVIDSRDRALVQISGTLYFMGDDFNSSDRLTIRYRINDSKSSRTVFRKIGIPNSNGRQLIYNSLPVPKGESIIHVEIEAKTTSEGAAEYQLTNLKIQ